MSDRGSGRATSAEEPRDRAEALRSLVEITGPIPGLIRDLESFPFGSDVELVELTSAHAVHALQMFKNGALTGVDMQSWAEALETREDLAYADDLGQILFELATPEINRPITRTLADEWLAALSH